ncbi:TetR/AcrR family transcriptional regulator [Brevibacterium samyangense]|uniref:HTH tetR-type domain-containing protein n=1 Tax=Brevibacterium samyangense TaxID=366888 RepID=A0ABN2TCQ9_9MICO
MARGDKGRRTRAELVAAARAVFAEKGYADTRLSDITARAGCSTGTLYTYFRNREEILAAVIDGTTDRAMLPGPSVESGAGSGFGASARSSASPDAHPDSPEGRIREGNRRYVEAYVQDADLMHLMEQVAHVVPGIQEQRMMRAKRFVDRNTRSIQRLQAAESVDPHLDARLTAQALSSMVSRLCYHIYVDDPDPYYATEEGKARLVDTLTRIWVNTLGLREYAGQKWLTRQSSANH